MNGHEHLTAGDDVLTDRPLVSASGSVCLPCVALGLGEQSKPPILRLVESAADPILGRGVRLNRSCSGADLQLVIRSRKVSETVYRAMNGTVDSGKEASHDKPPRYALNTPKMRKGDRPQSK